MWFYNLDVFIFHRLWHRQELRCRLIFVSSYFGEETATSGVDDIKWIRFFYDVPTVSGISYSVVMVSKNRAAFPFNMLACCIS